MHESRRLTRLPDESLRDGLVNADWGIIIQTVLTDAGITLDQASKKTRAFKIVMARHMIHYLLSIDPNRSFEAIAKVFMKDHATAIHSRNVMEELIETNREFKLKVISISTKIKNQHEEEMSDNR